NSQARPPAPARWAVRACRAKEPRAPSRSAAPAPVRPTTRPPPKAPVRVGCCSTTCWATETNAMPSPTQQTPEIATAKTTTAKTGTAKTETAMPRAHGRRRLRAALAVLGSTLAMLALAVAPQTSAGEPSAATTTAQPASSEPTSTGVETTTPGTSTAPPPTVSSPPAPSSTAPATPPSTEAPGQAGPEASTGGPQVEAQHTQNATPGGAPAGKRGAHVQAQAQGEANAGEGSSQTTGGTSGAGVRAGHRAPRPSSLTPALPLALDGSIAGVPGFFIESFRIPPFLLPIYQAAGTAYGIPWQVLAAINEVETDYGRDLSVSSAGAEGWMQFLPSTWETYGVDANGDGFKDPYTPADAIFAAARYLKAAGGDVDIRGAVYSYNHSQAYVGSVMLRAQLLGGTPPN